jgi:hypothetical protein
MKGEQSFLNLFPKPVHEEAPNVQRKKMQKKAKADLEQKNK